MASISSDGNGSRRIQFINAEGQRKTIRLSKASLRQAEAVKVKVQDLVAASITGSPPAAETQHWLAGLGADLYDKLVKAGLVKPRGNATLGQFTKSYIDGRVDIKPRTRKNLEQARAYLIDCFDPNRAMRDFTPGDAEEFRLHLLRQGKAENTVRRAVGQARQFFKAARQRGLVHDNPFMGVAATVRANPARFHFVSRADAEAVIEACPDIEWRMIFVLARYGGLRCPSEILSLKWSDINWEHRRIRVPSPKTAHHEGKDSRLIPLFPELRPRLLEGFELAESGAEHVITRYRDGSANLRTQLHRIIERAGLKPWPKTFQNLRSTRETELAEDFPMHAVCKWIGNSQPVATEHYLQLTDEHFERAVAEPAEKGPAQTAQNPAQNPSEVSGSERNGVREHDAQPVSASANNRKVPVSAGTFRSGSVRPSGVEPETS